MSDGPCTFCEGIQVVTYGTANDNQPETPFCSRCGRLFPTRRVYEPPRPPRKLADAPATEGASP